MYSITFHIARVTNLRRQATWQPLALCSCSFIDVAKYSADKLIITDITSSIRTHTCFTGGTMDRRSSLRQFLVSPSFQNGMQLGLGGVFCSLFVIIRSTTFPTACLAAGLFYETSLLMGQNAHVGTLTLGVFQVVGCVLLGCIMGGGVVSH